MNKGTGFVDPYLEYRLGKDIHVIFKKRNKNKI